MKKSFLFVSLLAVAALAGCKKDNLVTGDTFPMTEDGTAYIAVKISAAPGTRAGGSDGGFDYGDVNEHAVTSANFYFYDGNGVFVSQAQVWNGGTENTNTPDQNVEYMGNNVVMLKGLTDKTFPKYVVTVLNQPTGFVAGSTLKEMEETLVNSVRTGANFIMTTTSYDHGTGSNDVSGQPLYFATEVKESNFVDDPDGDITADPVVIYVERLAAKVTLKVDETKLTKVAENTYEVKVSVSGDPNDKNNNIGSEVLRVRFDGWCLNATSKQSYIVKNLDFANWTSFDWWKNVQAWSNMYRSGWAKSPAYGEALEANGTSKHLNYSKLSEATSPIGSSLYCAENTNNVATLTGHLGTVPTSVLLKATLLHKDGENWVAGNYVRYSGLLYKEDSFKDYVLNNLNTLGKLDYYRKVEDPVNPGKYNYTQVKSSDIEVVIDGGNSSVKLQLTTDAKTGIWVSLGVDPADPTDDVTMDINNLTTELVPFVGVGYKDGEMAYSIPIEHLHESVDLEEGNYGVVRNHQYVLTINKLNSIGGGIWNPGTGEAELPVIPVDPDKDLYQVGVQINILSWKIVNQSVEL